MCMHYSTPISTNIASFSKLALHWIFLAPQDKQSTDEDG